MAFGKDTDRVLKQLSSFDGELNFDYFNIDKLPNPLPSGLRVLRLSETKITELPPLPEGLEILVMCYVAGINAITKLPSTLKTLDCWGSPIKCLPQLPKGLIELIISRTKINCLPAQPDSLQVLRFSDTDIKYISHLSPSLRFLNVSGSSLKRLPAELPYMLENLHLEGSHITELPKELPKYLVNLVVNNTNISVLPPLPDSLRNLHIASTLIRALPNIPKSLEVLNCSRLISENLFEVSLPPTISCLECTCIYAKGKSIYDAGCFDCYYYKNCKGQSYAASFNTWFGSMREQRIQDRTLRIKSELVRAIHKPICFAY